MNTITSTITVTAAVPDDEISVADALVLRSVLDDLTEDTENRYGSRLLIPATPVPFYGEHVLAIKVTLNEIDAEVYLGDAEGCDPQAVVNVFQGREPDFDPEDEDGQDSHTDLYLSDLLGDPLHIENHTLVSVIVGNATLDDYEAEVAAEMAERREGLSPSSILVNANGNGVYVEYVTVHDGTLSIDFIDGTTVGCTTWPLPEVTDEHIAMAKAVQAVGKKRNDIESALVDAFSAGGPLPILTLACVGQVFLGIEAEERRLADATRQAKVDRANAVAAARQEIEQELIEEIRNADPVDLDAVRRKVASCGLPSKYKARLNEALGYKTQKLAA